MNWQEHIISDEEVLSGKPVIKGTRLSVAFILSLLAQGWTEQMLFENYPRLTREGLQAIYGFMNACMEDGLLFMPSKRAV